MFIYIKFVSSFQLFQQRSKNSKEIAEKIGSPNGLIKIVIGNKTDF